MPRPARPQIVHEIVKILLDESGSLSAGELAKRANLSRQAAHQHLRRLCAEGILRSEGRARATRYLAADRAPTRDMYTLRLELKGLEEHEVWRRLEKESPLIAQLPKRASDIAYFAFSALLNNAIDHSGGARGTVRVFERATSFVFEIEDDGEGAFEHVRRIRGLSSTIEAAQDISKGKLTTDPTKHTGQGIFFSARALDRLELESNGLRWTVDSLRNDTALGQTPDRRGTRVVGEIALDTQRELKGVFDEYSGENYAFTKTRTWVKLFETGLHFISRSEAKRLLNGLEAFEEIVLDFGGVTQVGQGFADEVFRVWALAHPHIRIEAVRMVPPVEHMVKRARGAPL